MADFTAFILDDDTNIDAWYYSDSDFVSGMGQFRGTSANVQIFTPLNIDVTYGGGDLFLYYDNGVEFAIRLNGNDQRVFLYGGGLVNVEGTAERDRITGNAAGNRLSGGAGSDDLNGAGGADTLAGGLGDDTYWIDDVADRVIEAKNEGYDTVHSSVSYSLEGQYVERIELIGAADINARGNTLANVLVGNEGVNVLTGWKGDDAYYIQTVGDQVIERKGHGYDTIHSTVTYSLAGQYVEALMLEGDGDIDAIGNSLDNSLLGNAGVNTLSGGKGNDTYWVQTVGDKVIEAKAQGYDVVHSEVSYALTGQYVEELRLEGDGDIDALGNTLDNFLIGNNGANHLIGLRGNDTLDGAGGVDTMEGGSGNDVYYVGDRADRVIETYGNGYDIVISRVDFSLTGQYIEELRLAGGFDLKALGNTKANTIVGNDSANVIDGWSGMDTLTGGAGSDTFVFSTKLGASNVDTITDFDRGVDTLQLSASAFSGLTAGALSEEAFVIGREAEDVNDRIIYDANGDGALFFDRDGSGTEYAAVQFATLSNHELISFSDFQVV